jgi:nucleotide-binding universal stress UspA family protein
MEIRRVLVPTDFSDRAERALPHALWLAEEFGAELHLLHAMVLHGDDPGGREAGEKAFPDLDDAYRQLRRWAAERMEESAAGLDRSQVEVVRAQERGIAAAPTIVEYAEDHDVDVVVMATHGRRGVRRMLLGSVTEEVLRTAGCPVLTVRPDGELEAGGPPERILVPVDFSEHSDLALASAGALARRFGAELDVLHVIAELGVPDPYFADAAELRALTKAARDRVPEALAERVDQVLGEDVPAGTHMEVGTPAAAIAEFAGEQGSDMIVLGSHGRTGMERVFLGSVAEGVVRRAPCAVLTVKPFGKKLAEA